MTRCHRRSIVLLSTCVLILALSCSPSRQVAPTSGAPTQTAPGPGASTRTAVPGTPAAGTPAASIPGATVPLATGGSVFVPQGALPAGATIDASVTRMPPLPGDVKPVGEAWSITASAQPSLPLTLRLPLPAGVSDPQKLAILHIEADGTTTFLVTRVEDDELVAETLGFSAYVTVELLRRGRQLFGPERLLVGETSTYFLWIPDPTTNVSTDWDCSGPADIIASSDWQATVQAGPSPGGSFWLHYRVLEQPKGDSLVRRWEGFRLIAVDDNPQRFRVVAAAAPSVARIGHETVNIVATVHGDYEPPIFWVWRFEGGGGGGRAETGAGTTRFELPAGTYPAQDQPGIYRVRIWAEDAQHRLSESWAGYELVGVEPFLVALEGPWRLSWTGPPGVYEEYTAVASGGKPPYKFSFLLFPGAKFQEGAGGLPKTTLQFDQPGEHRLEVACTDASGNTAKASGLITVQGGEPLSTRILELPATAQPQQEVTAHIQIRGGVLVTSGQKSGYRLEVDWGQEGSARVIEQNVGAQVTPYEGTVVLQFHTYNEAKTYTVRVEAFDAAGNMDWYEQDIMISAAPTPTQRPTAHLPAPSPVQQPTTGGTQLVWVRQPDPVVNVNNDILRYEEPEARWAGTFTQMTTSETEFTTEERYVEHEFEWYDLTITCNFDTPPPVLNPGQSYTIEARFTHEGTPALDGEGLGEQFWYAAQRGYERYIDPREVLRYGPWNPNFDGTAKKEWTLTGPPAMQEGETFDLYAGLWNRPPCNVTWTYRAEYQ